MTASPKFSRKTYHLVAEVFSYWIDGTATTRERMLIREFAVRFGLDNPRFDHDRFIKACGLPRKEA